VNNHVNGGFNGWQQQRQNYWNNWSNVNSARIDNFQQVREQRWDNIQSFRNDRWDSYMDHRQDWVDWRKDVWDFRSNRADEIRDYVRDSCDHFFTPDWWAACNWLPNVNVGVNVNPWWWWQPATWSNYQVVYQSAPPQPIVYDYGTDVVVHDEKVYVDGTETASAPDYREQALQLANPATPPPPPIPADSTAAGANDQWVPLGVWALTQEEKGDAVMFYQLTANAAGQISGAYSNVLTGESEPITGSIDKQTQRAAWHTGDNTGTAVEANLNGLTKDQTSVFVHFGTGKTQTWMLVRLPDPNLPTAPATLPTSAPKPK